MNVGKKKVDWVMADGTKYTAKKAAALTRLAKREKEGGSPGKKEEDEDEDDNNDGGAGSDGSGSSSSGTGGSSSSNGSSTIAAEATKAFVKMTTATEITTTSLPNGGSAQILPGELVALKRKRGIKSATKNDQLNLVVLNFPKRDWSVARREWWVRASELADDAAGGSLARRREWTTY